MNPVSRKVFKCNFCMDRLDQGLKPACVAGCTSRALEFLEISTVTFNKAEASMLGVLLHDHQTLSK